MTQKRRDIRRLREAGVDCACRCPKPCVWHSEHYRNEALNKLDNPRLTLSLNADEADEIAAVLVEYSDDYDNLPPRVQSIYDRLLGFVKQAQGNNKERPILQGILKDLREKPVPTPLGLAG